MRKIYAVKRLKIIYPFLLDHNSVPLRSYEIIINHIKTTKNSKGLKVDAHLVAKHDEKGKKISDKQMASLKIKRHKIFPTWNYTLMA